MTVYPFEDCTYLMRSSSSEENSSQGNLYLLTDSQCAHGSVEIEFHTLTYFHGLE